MKWIGNRISFVEDKQKTTIVIQPEKIGWINSLMGAWVAMWFTIGVTLIVSLFAMDFKKEEVLIVIIFLVFWLYYLVRVGRQFIWLLWGKEMIKLNTKGFVYKKDIKGYGKAILYYYDNMEAFESYIPEVKSIQYVWEKSPWTRGGERLQFGYQGRFIRFGRKLEEKEAKLLFQLVNNKRVEYEKIARREEKNIQAELDKANEID